MPYSRAWAFTNFMLDEDYDAIFAKGQMHYMIVGREQCPESKRWHDQGYMQLIKSREEKRAKNYFKGKPHVEAAKGDHESNVKYCSKPGTTVREWGTIQKHGGTRENSGRKRTKWDDILENTGETDLESFGIGGGDRIKAKQLAVILIRDAETADELELKFSTLEMLPVQKEMWRRLKEQNDRQITWVTDEKGGTGKSIFARWMQVEQGCIFLTSGKTADMMQSFFNQMAQGNKGKFVVIDKVRSQDEVFNYTALEMIKDGILVKSKYNSRTMILLNVKVIVLSNTAPNKDMLSDDRWDEMVLTRYFLGAFHPREKTRWSQ